jgi:transposase-like protein
MRKNQKYSKEEMYLAIELWQESGLSQVKFCSRENLSVKTFNYWYKKYKKENGLSVEENKETPDTFIPVKVSGNRTTTVGKEGYGRIELSFPNGVQLSCPVGIDIGQLKYLINF